MNPNVSSTRVQGKVTNKSTRWSVVEVSFQMPFQMALDLFFLYERSKKQCSSTMADSLYHGLNKANTDREDRVDLTVTYNNKGWKSWLLKVVRPMADQSGERAQNAAEFVEFLEGL